MEEYSLQDLQALLQSGAQTARSLTENYLQRIEQIDKNGPALNSVIELNPDALSIAAQLDDERQAGKIRGPLHGIPILVKDNIDTADRMTTTAGSLALRATSPYRMPLWSRVCERLGSCCLARPTSANGRIFAPATLSAVGAAAAARRVTRMPLTATRVAAAPDLASPSPRTCVRQRLVRKPTAQSYVHRTPMGSSGSNQPWVWLVVRVSFPSPTPKTLPVRWRAGLPMPPYCSAL